MKIEADLMAGAIYINVDNHGDDDPIGSSIRVSEDCIVDVSPAGTLMGIEILNVSADALAEMARVEGVELDS